MKKILVTIIFFLLMVHVQAQSEIRSGIVEKITSKEVYVKYDDINHPYRPGDKLHLMIGAENIDLEVTFPMQTFAKCRLSSSDTAKMSLIKKGMTVYNGFVPAEKSVRNHISPELRAVKIDDFSKFLGFTKSDKIYNVYKILGKSSAFNTHVQQDLWAGETNCSVRTVYSVSDSRLSNIDVQSGNDSFINTDNVGTKHFLFEMGIRDEKLGFLGASSSEVIEILGQPFENNSFGNDYCYVYPNIQRNQTVRFYFSKKDNICYRLFLYWAVD